MTAMRNLLVQAATICAVLVLAGCGASTSQVANPSQVPESLTPNVEPAQPAESEPMAGSLSDFLSAEPALPASPTATEGVPTLAETATPVPAPAADSPAEEPEDSEPADDEPDEAADTADDVPADSSEAITVEPTTVPAAGDYTLEVIGTGFTIGTDVLVIACVLPGEPLIRNPSADVVADRLDLLDVEQECNFDDGVQTAADDQGGFNVELPATIERNSMVLAADLVADLGAYILVPIDG